MTTTNELNYRIIELQDKQIAALEDARQKEKELHAEEMKRTKDLYKGAVQHVAAERNEATALAEELNKDVQHWQAQFDREHAAFVQAATDRDQAIKDKADLRRRNYALRKKLKDMEEHDKKLETEGVQLFEEHTKALEFIDNICEMVACDADLSDIADECMLWRQGEWAPMDEPQSIEDMVGSIIDEDPDSFFGGETIEDMEAEDRRRSDPNAPYRWKVLVVEHQGDEAVFTGWFANYDLARESVDLMVARGCYEAWVEELL